jgi:hypothetical protein
MEIDTIILIGGTVLLLAVMAIAYRGRVTSWQNHFFLHGSKRHSARRDA